jgi:hypothetical protein
MSQENDITQVDQLNGIIEKVRGINLYIRKTGLIIEKIEQNIQIKKLERLAKRLKEKESNL